MTFQFDYAAVAEAAKAAKPAKSANQLTEKGNEASLLGESISRLAAIAPAAIYDVPATPVDANAALCEARRKRFTALGIADAEALAQRLTVRDSEQDERRLCGECTHSRRSGCIKRDAWLPTVLQRCDNFLAAVLQLSEVA